MEEDECTKILDHLEQYVPHLEKVIAQLKQPKWRYRELQLNKLENLHSLITVRKKKLKLDTLRKCEDVILKVLHKVHPTIFKQLQLKSEPRSCANLMTFVCKYPSEEHKKISLGETDDFTSLQKVKAAKARLSQVDITPVSPSGSSIEYDLSKIPPIDFYSPTFNQTNRALLSPPPYADCPPYSPPLASGDQLPYTDRPKFDQWPQNDKGEWQQDESHTREREEVCRQSVSQNSQIRAREIKERAGQSNIKESSAPPSQIRMRRKSVDGYSGVDRTKYDAAYANLDCVKGKEETFISFFDNLYTTEEAPQRTGKGYGLQKFRMPKKNNAIDNRCHNQEKELKKEESCRKRKKKHDRKVNGNPNKHEEESVQLKRDIKNSIKYDPRSAEKSLTAAETSHSVENKENIVFKRLADKYNPRTRKTTTEVQNRIVLDNQQIDEVCTKIPFLNNIIPNKGNIIIDKIPSDIPINNPKQNRGHSWFEKNCPSFQSRNKTNSMDSSWFERNSPNFESKDNTNPMSGLQTSSHKQPLISSSSRGGSIIQPSSGSSNMQGNYASNNQLIHGNNEMVHVNNQMVYQKGGVVNQNQFIPSQHNSMNQNIPANLGENTYMNSIMLPNNVSNNISVNATPNTVHNKITPAEVIHPCNPIESSSEYDLSKMQPIDFYSPTFHQTKRLLLSPPNYANRSPCGSSFVSTDQPPYMRSPKYDDWPQYIEGQWQQERNHTHEREVVCRQSISQDPRIRAREIKERTAQNNIKEPPVPPPQLQIRRKLIDEYSGVGRTEYDAAYANLDYGRGKEESFISPLDNLYATGNALQKTEKGYGLQKFRIPKNKNVIHVRYYNEEKESKKESCKRIPQVIPQKVKDEVTGITLAQEKSVTPEKKKESKLEKEEDTVPPISTISEHPSTSTNEEKNSSEVKSISQ